MSGARKKWVWLKGFEVDISLPRSRWRDKPITMRVESGVKLHDAHATPSRRMGPRCRFWFPGDDLLDPEGGLYDVDDLHCRLRWAYPSALGAPFEQQVRELRIDDALCRSLTETKDPKAEALTKALDAPGL